MEEEGRGRRVNIKGGVREMKGGYGEKWALLRATNLTLYCCVYKEKIVKNDSYGRA